MRPLERASPEEEDQVIGFRRLAEGSGAGQAWETEPDRPDAYRFESLNFMN